MPRNKLFILLTTVFIGTGLLVAIHTLPLSSKERLIIPPDQATETIVLNEQNSARQGYRALGDYQSGIVFYLNAPNTAGQRFTARVLDTFDNERSKSLTFQKKYLPANNTLRLQFNFPWFKTKKNEHLIAEIKLAQGSAIPLRISHSDVYLEGTAEIHDQKVSRNLALAAIYPDKLSTSAVRGAIAGIIFLFALAVISTLPRRWQWGTAVVLLIVITPLALLGFFYSSGKLGISDWDYYFSYHEVVRRAVLNFHQFPLWNPWTCGGTAALADPEFPLFTFTFLLELILGIPLGLRLAIFLSVSVTAIGMLVLAKRLHLSLYAALLAALGVSFGSVTILEIVEGHSNVFAVMWIPWIFWAWLNAYFYSASTLVKKSAAPPQRHSLSRLVIASTAKNIWPLTCGVFLALTFYAGGIYLLMYTLLAFIALIPLTNKPLRALLITTQAGLWAIGLAALKLVPVLLWLRQFPDQAYASSAFTLPWLTEILFGRHLHGAYIIFRQNSGWHEYGAYVGYLIFALALIGASKFPTNRILRALIFAAIAATLLSSLGPALKPYFDVMPFFPRSNISRFILFVIIPISLLAGYGLDHLTSLFSSSAGRKALTARSSRGPTSHGLPSSAAAAASSVKILLPLLLVSLAAIDLMSLSSQLSQQAFVLPDVANKPSPAPYPLAYTAERFNTKSQETKETRSYAATLAGYGTLTYCSVLGPPPMVRTIHDKVDNGLFMSRPRGAAIKLVSWTPNKIIIDTKIAEKTRLILNTNYAIGWFVNGQSAINDSGRVAGELPPGQRQITFQYHAPGLTVGLAVTVLSLVLAVFTVYLKYKMHLRKIST